SSSPPASLCTRSHSPASGRCSCSRRLASWPCSSPASGNAERRPLSHCSTLSPTPTRPDPCPSAVDPPHWFHRPHQLLRPHRFSPSTPRGSPSLSPPVNPPPAPAITQTCSIRWLPSIHSTRLSSL